LETYLKFKQEFEREFNFIITEELMRRVAYCKLKANGRHVIIDYPKSPRTIENLFEWMNLEYSMFWLK